MARKRYTVRTLVEPGFGGRRILEHSYRLKLFAAWRFYVMRRRCIKVLNKVTLYRRCSLLDNRDDTLLMEYPDLPF
jgi:hypothetical protein